MRFISYNFLYGYAKIWRAENNLDILCRGMLKNGAHPGVLKSNLK